MCRESKNLSYDIMQLTLLSVRGRARGGLVFGLQKLQLINFFHFFIWESHFEREKNEKSLITFILLFNDLKFGKNSLFCCNGYSLAIFTIIFHGSQVEYLRKAFTKELKKKNSAYLLLFYDLTYLI